MPASDTGATYISGRRPKVAKERTRGGWGAENAAHCATVAPDEMTKDLSCPLLGIFGNDDRAPSPEQVNQHEAELKKPGKMHEFYRYDGAGHGIFYWHRPLYRPEQAMDGWSKVFAFRQASGAVGGPDMCTSIIEIARAEGMAKRGDEWFPLSLAVDHARHEPLGDVITLDFINTGLEPGARAGIELTLETASRVTLPGAAPFPLTASSSNSAAAIARSRAARSCAGFGRGGW